MDQLTIRGFDDQLARKIRELARAEGLSLNKAALRLLRRGAGLGPVSGPANTVGSSLDHLIGSWTDAEADEFDEAVADFETVDESQWE